VEERNVKERKREREREKREAKERRAKKGKRENGKEVGTSTTLAAVAPAWQAVRIQFSPVLQRVATGAVLANAIAYLLCFLLISGASFVSDIRCCYCALKY
jgi:hypothetical protein